MGCETLALRDIALTQTYEDVKMLIYQTCWKFTEAYGGEIEEWIAEANYYFLRAYESYQESKGTFSTWLRRNLWQHLMNYSQRLRQIHKNIEIKPMGDEIPIISVNDRRLEDLLEEFSADLREIVDLVLDPPDFLINDALEKGTRPYNFRGCLRRYLKSTGRTAKEITESFAEIGEILSAN
jgi:DNA-directed RNA polymerase specialized sigma24 family protein